MAQLTVAEIDNLLNELKSKDRNKRALAASKLGKVTSSQDAVIAALQHMIAHERDDFVKELAKSSIQSLIDAKTLHKLQSDNSEVKEATLNEISGEQLNNKRIISAIEQIAMTGNDNIKLTAQSILTKQQRTVQPPPPRHLQRTTQPPPPRHLPMYCTSCGASLDNNDKFCTSCGKSITHKDVQKSTELGTQQTVASMKSYTGSAVLVFLLYLFFFIPGFIVNFIYYREANHMSDLAGHNLPGQGCLGFMLWFNVAMMIIAVIGVLILGIASM